MKQPAIFSFLLFLLLSTQVYSQSGLRPPNRVQANFNAKYPELAGNARWQQNENGYQAAFRQNNKEVVSDFGPDGQWLQSRTELLEEELPPPARMYISDTYPVDYDFVRGYRIDNTKGSRYEVELRSQGKTYQLSFDKQGGFVDEGPQEN